MFILLTTEEQYCNLFRSQKMTELKFA